MRKYSSKIKIYGIDVTDRYIDRRIARVIEAANDLADGHSGDIGFLHSAMCQTFLPYRTPQLDVRHWESTNGHTSMVVEAGRAYDPHTQSWRELPIPAGTKARLAIIYLSTAAIKNNSPIITLDRSMSNFLRSMLRRRPNASDMTQFKLQISALGAATVRLANDNRQSNSHIVSDFDLMWCKRQGRRILWPTELELSAEYWNTLKDKAVPIDLKAITAISHSALAIDIYLWLAQRLWRINDPYTVYWTVLWKQFGRGYGRIRDFREKFRQALRYATAVYPEAIIQDVISEDGRNAGVKLFKSPPPIPIRK